MSGWSRRLSTVAVSHFCAVACSSAFCSTVLRPPSSWRHTGTKPECSDIAIRVSPHEWWRLAEAILASGGPPAKRRLSGSATRRPGTWAGDVLDQLTSVLRGRGGEAARHSVCRGRGSFLLSASDFDNRQFTHAGPYHRPCQFTRT